MPRWFKTKEQADLVKVVRVSERNYRQLYKIAKDLSKTRPTEVSMSAVLDHILNNHFYKDYEPTKH